MFHALGFSADLFDKFRDCSTGKNWKDMLIMTEFIESEQFPIENLY